MIRSGTGIGGSFARFTVVNDYLYTVDQSNLKSFLISNPSDPQLKNTNVIGWGIETIFPYKDKLFVGSNTGMYIFDNSRPESPVLLSIFEHARACDPVVVHGNTAYVPLRDGSQCTGFTNQLENIDITNVLQPKRIKTYPMSNPHGLSYNEGKIYLAEGEYGFRVLDVEDSNNVNELCHEFGHAPMILALSLQGRLRNFRLPAYRALVPVFEALMNAVHAIDAAGRPSGRVTVEVLRRQGALPLTDSVPKAPPSGFRISDDGVGFTDENYSSFCTSDSTYKLKLGGRGIGRFTWLKAFESVRIESVYATSDGKQCKRAFTFSEQGIPDNDAKESESQRIGTTITLEDVHREYAPHIPKKLETLAQRIVDHCFMAVRVATAKIELVVVDGDESVNVSDEIRRMFETAQFDDLTIAGHDFRVTHVRVAARDAGPHRLAFLANSREVRSDRLESAIPQLCAKLGGGDGEPFWWLSLVESRALDEAVSSERDSFDIPEEPLELYPDFLSMALV